VKIPRFIKKAALFFPVLLGCILASGCVSNNYTAGMSGSFNQLVPTVKNFDVIGVVVVQSTETHSAGPLGFVKKVEGAKVTYSDLVLKAEKLTADDIIDVRIDMDTNGKTTFFAWLTGWTRTFTYTGKAIAIKYINNEKQGEKDSPDLFRR
jgi:uncharacterized protein YbjQ (UPF0145 family)